MAEAGQRRAVASGTGHAADVQAEFGGRPFGKMFVEVVRRIAERGEDDHLAIAGVDRQRDLLSNNAFQVVEFGVAGRAHLAGRFHEFRKPVAIFDEVLPPTHTVDFEVLKQLLGGAVDEREEKYGLNWHGKRRARQLALTSSTGTLRPCPGDGVDEATTQNIVIEGDNLEVLKLLQKSYSGKVKLIYIDPPYNTGHDFVYPDDFRDSIGNYKRLTGQVDGEGRKLTSNPETSGRFHTDWLNMMYPRLKLARNLLREDGILLISIDDNEVHGLRAICDDIFGSENFVCTFLWQKRISPDNDEQHVTSTHDYVVCYMRSKSNTPIKGYTRTSEQDDRYTNPDSDSRGPWTSSDITRREFREHDFYEIALPSGRTVLPSGGRSWSIPPAKFKELVADNRIWFGPDGNSMPRFKRFITDVSDRVVPVTWLTESQSGNNQSGTKLVKSLFPELQDTFNHPKPIELVANFLHLGSSEQDIILDFFAGSGTTGHAVMAQNAADGGNRRYILVQLPEPLDPANTDQKTAANFCDGLGKPRTIAELTKERLRRAGKKIVTEQTENAEKKKKESEKEKKLTPSFLDSDSAISVPSVPSVLDIGFRVFKLDSSNIRTWEPDRNNLDKTLEEATVHIKSDRSEADILTELLLKLGLDLTIPITTKTIAGKPVHSIGAGVLHVCLDREITRADAEPRALDIAAWHKEQKPAGESKVVFRDSAFADDVAKSNLAAILYQHGLKNVRSL